SHIGGPVHAREITKIAGRLLKAEGDVEYSGKSCDNGFDAGLCKGVLHPFHQMRAVPIDGLVERWRQWFQGCARRRPRGGVGVVCAPMDPAAGGEQVEQISPSGDRRNWKAVGDSLAEGR